MRVIQPPKDEAQLGDTIKWLMDGLKALGMELDPEGLLLSWTSGYCKVIIDAVKVGDPIQSAGLLVIGKKWTTSGTTASLLELRGDRKAVIEYSVNLASAFGAERVLYEADSADEPGVLHRMHEIVVG